MFDYQANIVFLFSRKPALQLYLKAGHKIGKPVPLFEKIEQSRLDELKKQYGGVQEETKPTAAQNAGVQSAGDVEKLITEQGNKVRALKAAKAEKSIVQAEVKILLDLKKKLEDLQKGLQGGSKPASGQNEGVQSIADVEKSITEQGNKVRALKAAKAEKSIVQAEVKILLDLKKKLENLQSK